MLSVSLPAGGKWVEMTIPADPLYQHLLLTAEKKFWRCVETGETPHLFGVEPPRPQVEAVRIIDMEVHPMHRRNSPVFFVKLGRPISTMTSPKSNSKN